MDPKAFKPAAKMIPKQTAYETRKNMPVHFLKWKLKIHFVLIMFKQV